MALLMTVQKSTSGQRRTKGLEDDLEASGGHLEAIGRALAVHFEVTWSTCGPLRDHLEPTWRPLGGHLEATWSPSWPKTRPRDAQEPPKGSQERPKSAPRASQERPKSAHERCKSAQERPKSHSRAPRDAPERPWGTILRLRSSKEAAFEGDPSRDSVEKRVRNDFRSVFASFAQTRTC